MKIQNPDLILTYAARVNVGGLGGKRESQFVDGRDSKTGGFVPTLFLSPVGAHLPFKPSRDND